MLKQLGALIIAYFIHVVCSFINRISDNRSHPVRRVWKCIMLCTALVVSCSSPYIVAFVWIEGVGKAWRFIDSVTFTIYFIDATCKICFTKYDTRATIVSVIEVIANLPISLVFLTPIPNPLSWTLYGLRTLQIIKLFKTLSRWRVGMPRRRDYILRLMFLITLAVFSLHLVARGFYRIAKENSNVEKTWLSLVPTDVRRFPYLLSFYWVSTVFSTVGYGDIHPVNIIEMAFNIVIMFYFAVLFTFIFGELMDILTAYRRIRSFGVSLSADKINTYIILAIYRKELELLKMIIAFGGEVNNVLTPDQETPIHLAVRTEFVEGAEYLLELGADCDAPNAFGMTARQSALSDGSEAMKVLMS